MKLLLLAAALLSAQDTTHTANGPGVNISIQFPASWEPYESGMPGVILSHISPDKAYAVIASAYTSDTVKDLRSTKNWAKAVTKALDLPDGQSEFVPYTAPPRMSGREAYSTARMGTIILHSRNRTITNGKWLLRVSVTMIETPGVTTYRAASAAIMNTLRIQ